MFHINLSNCRLPLCFTVLTVLLLLGYIRIFIMFYHNAKPSYLDKLYDGFPAAARDGANLRWSHRTNNEKALQEALNSQDVHLIEADVLVTAVAGHSVKKGIKLDFKSPAAVESSMRILADLFDQKMLDKLPVVWLNADILAGNGGNPDATVPAELFLSQTQEWLPSLPLSLGWSTLFKFDHPKAVYTQAMVTEMITLLQERNICDVTFPIRAGYLYRSWDAIWNLLQPTDFTITLWHASADDEDVDRIRETVCKMRRSGIAKDRIFYDMPKELLTMCDGAVNG